MGHARGVGHNHACSSAIFNPHPPGREFLRAELTLTAMRPRPWTAGAAARVTRNMHRALHHRVLCTDEALGRVTCIPSHPTIRVNLIDRNCARARARRVPNVSISPHFCPKYLDSAIVLTYRSKSIDSYFCGKSSRSFCN